VSKVELKPLAWFPFGARYADEMSSATAASRSFHYASLLTVAGAILGRRVRYTHATILYPNFFTCLVGESGVTYKGTCQKLGLRLRPDIHKLFALSTMEGLLVHLQQWPDTLIVLEELSMILKKSKQDYSSAIIPRLAELYDNPDVVHHPTKSTPLIIKEPCVSILAATTPEWLEVSMEKADIFGGLANRFIYVVGYPGMPLSAPRMPDFSKLQEELDVKLSEERWPRGTELRLDSEAAELWDVTFNKWFEKLKTYDELRRALCARHQDYVFKSAMVIHCLEGYGNLISWQTMEAAIAFVEYLRECLDEIRPVFSSVEDKILKVIVDNPGIRRGSIHKAISGRYTGNALSQSLGILLKFKRIEEVNGGFYAVK
jgi:hypothetical protein